jgi:hypothetical protein
MRCREISIKVAERVQKTLADLESIAIVSPDNTGVTTHE